MVWCQICKKNTNEFGAPKQLLCGHSFHETCIDTLFQAKKMCPVCKDEFGEPSRSGYALLHLMDNLHCHGCRWKPVKRVTFRASSLKLEYLLNHQCDLCQLNSYRFRPSELGIKNLLSIFDSSEESLSDLKPLSLVDQTSRPYHAYDYLRCKRCSNYVCEFQEDDVESLVKQAPERRILNSRLCKCFQCRQLIWGTLLKYTYQDLPKCVVCKKLVEHKDMQWRMCCTVRGKRAPFHVDCSVKEAKCPNCHMECTIGFEISKSDPSLQDVTIVEGK